MIQPPQGQQPQRLTPSQYQQLSQNWNQMPTQWNPDGVYGGIKEVRTGGRVFLYIIPLLGSLLVALAVFLPWFSINFFGAGLSTNGIGALSAPPGFVESVKGLSQSQTTTPTTTPTGQPFEVWHGWALIGLAVITLALCAFGIVLKSKAFSIGPLVAGLIGAGLGGLDWWRTFKLIDDTYKQLASPVQTALVNIQVGFGLYLVTAASLGMVIGAILVLAMFDKKSAF